MKSRAARRLALCAAIVVAGLSLRAFGFGLGAPALLVKYGGSALWAAMVYLLVAIIAPSLGRPAASGVAMAIAIAVESFRLFHAPWLDAFRLTLPGALLLGRIFSLWNLVAYAAGVGLGAAMDMAAFEARERACQPRRAPLAKSEATDAASGE